MDFALSPKTFEALFLAYDMKDLGSLGTGNRIDLADSRAAEVPGPAEIAVHNRASILADHTTYTTNVRQVIDPVARLLMTLGGRDAALPPRDTAAADRHVDAVRMLGAMRISALVASVVGLVALTSRGVELPIFDWLVRAVRPVSAGTARGVSWLVEQSWQGYIQFVITAALAAAVLIGIGSALWRSWHRALSWDRSRWVVARMAIFVAYFGLTVATSLALVALELDDVLGWWVWPVAATVGVGLVFWPMVGPRPEPLPARRAPISRS